MLAVAIGLADHSPGGLAGLVRTLGRGERISL
jgi:hypothetical protein